jgi:hypothetical protein
MDSNTNDASGGFTDIQANDSAPMQGTSMAAPIVAGAEQIIVQAMGGYTAWNYTRNQALMPKTILLMTATETYPNLRELSSSSYSPTLDRGGKDVHEGYGRLNLDAGADAVLKTYQIGNTLSDSLGKPPTQSDISVLGQRLAWARNVQLVVGVQYNFSLNVPSGADYDLYLYNTTGNAYGEPVIVAKSTTAATGGIENIVYTPSMSGKYYIVVKLARENSGGGQFTLSSIAVTPELGLKKVTVWYWNSGSVVNSVVTGDVDGDGSVEVVTGGYYFDGTRNVAQLCVWNGPDGSFEQVKAWYWTGNTTINSVAIGDVDNDGKMEIVTGGCYFDGARKVAQLLVWNGATLAVEGVKTWFWVGDTAVNSVVLGDVDADNQIEIVSAGTYVDSGKTIAQLAVWAGSGLGLDRISVWVTGGSNCVLNSVALGDVDADGQIEIATGGSYFDGTRNVAELRVWSGSSLVLEQNKPWYWISNTTVVSVAIGDVDGDGLKEIVTGGYYFDGSRNIAQVIEWAGSGLSGDRLFGHGAQVLF